MLRILSVLTGRIPGEMRFSRGRHSIVEC